MSLWSWLIDQGAIEGDPAYYESGGATATEIRHAIDMADLYFRTKDSSLWAELVSEGAITGDPTYYESGDAGSSEMDNAVDVADKYFGGGGLSEPAYAVEESEQAAIGELPDSTASIPRDASLVKVDGQYRVIWDLGEGLGAAWYEISNDQLRNIYGENYDLYVSETFYSDGAFEGKYGNYKWGNVAEISINADTPWQDLKERVFAAYGFIAGFDDPEVKRLILQGYFEDWDNNEFIANYQNTAYYRNLNELARDWSTKTDEEKAYAIRAKAGSLVEDYRDEWGSDPLNGLDNPEILSAAEAILSGGLTQEEWSYNTRTQASAVENTPAARRVVDETQAQGEQQTTIANLTKFAMDQWRLWMGPTEIPQEFAQRWGQDLYFNRKSEADLDLALRSLSQGTWQMKPENVTWDEWAAPAKSKIRSQLELTTLDDNDPLLNSILDSGLSGQDALSAIRNDSRFLGTNQMYDQLSTAVSELGRTFGFIA